MKNPVILHLMSRDYTFSDLEYNTSDIAYYYILPARELKEKEIEFKESVEDDELILILFFKDSSYNDATVKSTSGQHRKCFFCTKRSSETQRNQCFPPFFR